MQDPASLTNEADDVSRLIRSLRNTRRLYFRYKIIVLGLIGGTGLVNAASYVESSGLLVLMTSVVAFFAIRWWTNRWQYDRERRRTVELLGASGDARAVGPILECFTLPDRTQRLTIARVLPDLLNSIETRQPDLLTLKQLHLLHDLLCKPSHAKRIRGNDRLAIAGACALGFVGNGESIHRLKYLSGRGIQPAALRETAKSAHDRLSGFLADEARQASLLRPASPDGAELLRPAGSASTAEENLLRPL